MAELAWLTQLRLRVIQRDHLCVIMVVLKYLNFYICVSSSDAPITTITTHSQRGHPLGSLAGPGRDKHPPLPN